MTSDNITKEKLPLKSTHGHRCLTKCYPKGTTLVHPVILTGIKNKIDNYCAIDPIYRREFEGNKLVTEKELGMVFIDACKLEDNKIYEPPNELESMLLSFYFNPREFLSQIYDLFSFDAVIYWTLTNDYLPFDTIKRIHNCAWKAYGNKIEELSNKVIEYYYDMAKNRWLHDYVKIIQNKYSFSATFDKKLKLSSTLDEIYNIISVEFFDYIFFNNAIKRYVYQYQDKWDSIESHYGKLKDYIFQQLIEHIEQKLRV